MKLHVAVLGLVAAATVFATGCSTAPKTEEGKEKLAENTKTALARLHDKDPGLQGFLDKAYAYAIFPTAGKGGAIIGGAYGHGEVYEQGRLVGYADISQATIGAQLGGESFTEILAFENQGALDRFKQGKLKFAANASAVAMKSGAAATARYSDGVATFVEPRAGLMAEAAIGGQSFSYQPIAH